jgi:ABC-type antimicrobial peptide transport system permease subunit
MVKFSIGGNPAATHNQTTKEILYGYDNFFTWNGPDPAREALLGNNSVCVVNQFVTSYDDTGNPEWTYEIQAGDVIEIEIPGDSGDMFQNFTVVGTVDSHLPYYSSPTSKTGAVLNPMTANYNFLGAEDPETPFIDTFDADGNVIISSYRMLHHLAYLESGLPWGYDPEDINNHFYVQATGDPAAAVSAIRAAINAAANNYSVYAIKAELSAQSTRTGALLARIQPGYSEEQAVDALRNYYQANNITWNEGAWRVPSMVGDPEYVNAIASILNILVISALVVALLGLVEIIAEEITARKWEHGLIRVLGFSRGSIPSSIFIELLTIGIIGALIGALIGITTMWIILSGISASLLKPMYFGIPAFDLMGLGLLFVGLFVVGGIVLARRTGRQSVIENLQILE